MVEFHILVNLFAMIQIMNLMLMLIVLNPYSAMIKNKDLKLIEVLKIQTKFSGVDMLQHLSNFDIFVFN